MHLRVGIIYLILQNKLSNKHYKEIIFWSKWIDDIKFYYDLYHIIQIIKSDIKYDPPVDFKIENFISLKILEHLANFDIFKILESISYYYLEYSKFSYDYNKYLQFEDPRNGWKLKTIGLNYEKKMLLLLNEVYGFKIISSVRQTYTIPNSDGIYISGTPDGYICESPGNIYDDHIIEFKFINDEQNCKLFLEKTKIQLAGYYKTHNKPIILIVYVKKFNCIKLFRYSNVKLENIWQNMLPQFVANCKKLKSTLCVKNVEQIPKYLAMF